LRIRFALIFVVITLATIPTYYVITNIDYIGVDQTRENNEAKRISGRSVHEIVKEAPPAIAEVPEDLPKPPLPKDPIVIRDPPQRPPLEPPLQPEPPPEELPIRPGIPKLLTLPLSLIIPNPNPQYPHAPMGLDATYDGVRYIYSFVLWQETTVVAPRTTRIEYRCGIVQIDAMSMLASAPQPSQGLLLLTKIWDPKLNCNWGEIGASGIAYANGHVWVYAENVEGGHVAKFDPSSGKVVATYGLSLRPNNASRFAALRIASDGFIYVAKGGTSWIVKLDPNSGKTSFLSTRPYYPNDLYIEDNFIYFTGEGTPGVGRINKDGTGLKLFYHSLASQGICNHCGTSRIVKGPDGKFWFTSEFLKAIGVMDPASGMIKIHNLTIFSPDENRTKIEFRPIGLAFDRAGKLWIAGRTFDYTLGIIVKYDPVTQRVEVTGLRNGLPTHVVLGPRDTVWSLIK